MFHDVGTKNLHKLLSTEQIKLLKQSTCKIKQLYNFDDK